MNVSRRRFFQAGALVGLGLSGRGFGCLGKVEAIEPFRRAGSPRFLLSLAAYSLRNYFIDNNRGRAVETDPVRRIDLFQFIDYCAQQGCDGVELTSYFFPAHADRDYFHKLKRYAFLKGLPVSGTAVGNDFVKGVAEEWKEQVDYVKRWVDYAHLMGAPHIRVFAGNRGDLELEKARDLVVTALRECADYAGDKGVMLGLENHDSLTGRAEDLIGILDAVDHSWLGINLDTGNFHTDDPYADMKACAPYSVNVQMKTEIRRDGKEEKEAADLPRITQILREANYQGYVALEYEAEQDPWEGVPNVLQRMKLLLTS